MQKGLCLLLFLYQKEYQNYLSKVSCLKNIILCNFTTKSKRNKRHKRNSLHYDLLVRRTVRHHWILNATTPSDDSIKELFKTVDWVNLRLAKYCWTMLLLYIIKCRLFTRKWHKMEQSLMWQNGIWWVEYNSIMWNIAYCSCRAMIGHVLIRFWTLFSWYVFTMYIVSKGAEKTPFNLKNDAES